MTRSTTGTAAATPLPSPKERRRLREAKSLSEEQVATAVGVTRATVRSWETGRSSPRGRNREAYARVIGAVAKPGPETGPDTGPDTEPDTKTGTRPGTGPDTEAGTRPDTEPRTGPDTEPEPAAEATGSSTMSPSPTLPVPPTLPITPAEQVTPAGPAAPAESVTPMSPAAPAEPRATAEQAFDVLYAGAAPGLVQQTYLLTGRRDLSREAVERAFQLAWHRWPEVARDRDPAGWVRAAAYEYAMSPWHRLRRAHRYPDPPPEEPARRALLGALLDLPPSYRRTLLLYDAVGLDLPETAAETEASTAAAANRLLHARAALAEQLPELADPAPPGRQSTLVRERLGGLAGAERLPALPAPRLVRTGGERKAQLWTRAAGCFAALLIGLTAFTLQTAPTRYEQPLSPAQRVGGVPQRSGPQKLTPQDLKLQKSLREQSANGPGRLVPRIP